MRISVELRPDELSVLTALVMRARRDGVVTPMAAELEEKLSQALVDAARADPRVELWITLQLERLEHGRGPWDEGPEAA